MKGTEHVVVLIFAIIAVSCAVVLAYEDGSQFIIGGENATIEEYPYMAGVFVFGNFLGTGAIINSRSILTAAHCIHDRHPTLATTISVGSSTRSGEGGVMHRALRAHKHPGFMLQFDPFFITNDIAIVRTISQIMFTPTVQPIQIAPMIVPPASDVMAIGWGLTGNDEGDFFTEQLQTLQMRTISNLECFMMHDGTGIQQVVTAETVCTIDRDAANSGGICRGDSGGPLIWNNMVAGVASWSVPPCGSMPSGYVRVSHHIRWIRQHL